MLDRVSLDQLRTFIAAADGGSFSAAGRRLRRAQSVVSQTLASMEAQIGVKLFDRSGRCPVLTDQGRALLSDARAVASDVDVLKARAKSLAGGLEPELSSRRHVSSRTVHPRGNSVPKGISRYLAALRHRVERSGGPVLNGHCCIGVWGAKGDWALAPPQLAREALLTIRTPFVVSSQHPLATRRAPIALTVLAEHVHVTHADIRGLSRVGGSIAPLSPRVWRLSHLGNKLAFLRAGLGFGIMPLHMIEADLASGALVKITIESVPPEGFVMEMSAIYRTDRPPGPAGRWFIEHLKEVGAVPPKETPPVSTALIQRLRSVSNHVVVLTRRGNRRVDSTERRAAARLAMPRRIGV